MEYQLDSASARNGDKTGGKFIDESGAYEGTFTRVESLVSKDKGTHGVGFTFKSTDEKTVNFDVWTVKGNGEKLSGFDAIQAIMTCMKVRNIKPEPMTVTKYDFEARQDRQVNISGFTSLMNKPVGVFLQKELSIYDGKEKAKMVLQGSFERGTRFTASEILDQATEPKNYANKLAWLDKNPVKDSRGKSGGGVSTAQGSNAAAPNGFEEDIPW